jgi:DNA polymerase III epsilon subunit family exonuclease
MMYPREYQKELAKQIKGIAFNVILLKSTFDKNEFLSYQASMRSKVLAEKKAYDDAELLFYSHQLFSKSTGKASSLSEVERSLIIDLAERALIQYKADQNWLGHLEAVANMSYTLNFVMEENNNFIDEHMILALTNLRVIDLNPFFCENFIDDYSNYFNKTTNSNLKEQFHLSINVLFENWVAIGENMLKIDPKVVPMGKFELDYLDYFVRASDLPVGNITLTEEMLRHKLRTGILLDEYDGGTDPIYMIVSVLEEMHPKFEDNLELLNEVIDYLNNSLIYWEGMTLKEVIKSCSRFNSVLDDASVDKIIYLVSGVSKQKKLTGNWPKGRFAFFDVETTGLHPEGGDKIVEWAVVIVEDGEIVDREQMLVNPMRRIPPRLTQEVHGISDNMVKDKPIFADTSIRLISMIRESVIVAHKANFDARFLGYELGKIQKGIQSLKFIDSIKIAKHFHRSSANYSLGNLCHQFGIDTSGAHRAMKDVEMMYLLFDEFFKKNQAINYHMLLEIGLISTPKIDLVAACQVNNIMVTIGLEYTISYLSKNNERTTRKIRIDNIIRKNNEYILEAYCYTRLNKRSFLSSRIIGIVED